MPNYPHEKCVNELKIHIELPTNEWLNFGESIGSCLLLYDIGNNKMSTVAKSPDISTELRNAGVEIVSTHWTLSTLSTLLFIFYIVSFFGSEPHPSVFDCKSKSLFNFQSSIPNEMHVTIQFIFFIYLYKLISFSQISFEISSGILLPALHWRKEKHQQTNLISLFTSVCWTNYQLQVKEKWFIISFLTPI